MKELADAFSKGLFETVNGIKPGDIIMRKMFIKSERCDKDCKPKSMKFHALSLNHHTNRSIRRPLSAVCEKKGFHGLSHGRLACGI